jgi:phage-Barnase-EndoU-ColicinE5/D-RelE like nuclease3
MAGSKRSRISEVVRDAQSRKHINKSFAEYHAVSPLEADRIKREVGLDVSGYVHSLDEAAVRHILNRHGPNGTADQSLSPADFEDLPTLVGQADSIASGHVVGTIEYRKKLGADWIVIEERRTGRRKLALVTMFKEKATSY